MLLQFATVALDSHERDPGVREARDLGRRLRAENEKIIALAGRGRVVQIDVADVSSGCVSRYGELSHTVKPAISTASGTTVRVRIQTRVERGIVPRAGSSEGCS